MFARDGPSGGFRVAPRPVTRAAMTTSSARLPKHTFSSDGVEIAYFDTGEGDPVLCIHGFASTAHINWTYPGWVDTLTKAGRRVIALDNRGHGDSEKLYDPAAYHTTLMAEDARALLDHLGIAQATVLGYSMGSRITAFLAQRHPDRVKAAIMGGLGIKLIDGVGLPETIAEALEAPTLEEVTDPQGRMFRAFAMQTKSDRRGGGGRGGAARPPPPAAGPPPPPPPPPPPRPPPPARAT